MLPTGYAYFLGFWVALIVVIFVVMVLLVLLSGNIERDNIGSR